jgi:hypothetical protein
MKQSKKNNRLNQHRYLAKGQKEKWNQIKMTQERRTHGIKQL